MKLLISPSKPWGCARLSLGLHTIVHQQSEFKRVMIGGSQLATMYVREQPFSAPHTAVLKTYARHVRSLGIVSETGLG